MHVNCKDKSLFLHGSTFCLSHVLYPMSACPSSLLTASLLSGSHLYISTVWDPPFLTALLPPLCQITRRTNAWAVLTSYLVSFLWKARLESIFKVLFYFLSACKILVPWPGIKPWPLAVRTLGPDHWTVREFLGIDIFIHVFIDIFKLDNSITLVYLKSVYSNLPTWYSSVGKETACNAGDPVSIPGSGRSPGEGKGNPLQYSCLENPMDRGVWEATVHGVTRVGHS